MSQENVEIARRAFAIYNTHDVQAMQDMVTEDAEFRTFVEGRAEGEPLRGHDGIAEWQRSEKDAGESLRVEPDEFRDLGNNRVLVTGNVVGRGRASGVELNAPAAWVVTIRGSRFCAFRAYGSRAEALEAAGLRQ